MIYDLYAQLLIIFGLNLIKIILFFNLINFLIKFVTRYIKTLLKNYFSIINLIS